MTQDQIADISWRVDNLVSEYLAIHDKAFQKSIRYVTPIPGIFKAIDFGALEHQSGVLVKKLKNCKMELESISQEYSGAKREFSKLLVIYTDAVVDSLGNLNIILSRLYAKSQAPDGLDYARKNYKNDLVKYHESVDKWKRIGEKLDVLAKESNT